jgi:hypothetical protein
MVNRIIKGAGARGRQILHDEVRSKKPGIRWTHSFYNNPVL